MLPLQEGGPHLLGVPVPQPAPTNRGDRDHRPSGRILNGWSCPYQRAGFLKVSGRQDGSCQRRVKEIRALTTWRVPLVLSSVSTIDNVGSHLIVPCEINEYEPVDGMIDCGATGLAFMNTLLARHLKLKTTKLEEPQEVVAADGHAMDPITETVNIRMKIKDHVEDITMFLSNIGSFNIILGMPWL